MKKIIALSAAVSLLGATAALSQTTTQPQTTPPQTTTPQQTTPPVGVPPTPQVQTTPAPKTTTPKSDQHTFLDQQKSGQVLASDFMKKSILGANNERIGDVNDLLMSQDGDVVAVLVGVGGFLGIGEKTVAIPFDSLKRSPDADQLTAQYSREDLRQAPEFVTAKRSERGTGTTGTTGTGTTRTAPSGTQR